MAPAPIIIDTSDDFLPAPKKSHPATQRNLLLAPPSIAAHEDKLRDIFALYDRSSSDLQMLDRLSAGLVSLPSTTYDLILVLTDANGERRHEALQLLTRDVYSALVPAMKVGAKFQLQDGPLSAAEGREAILAGLVENQGFFERMEEEEVVVMPLRFGKKTNGQNGAAPKPASQPVQINLDDDFGSDDELIDEDDLLTTDDLKRPIVQR